MSYFREVFKKKKKELGFYVQWNFCQTGNVCFFFSFYIFNEKKLRDEYCYRMEGIVRYQFLFLYVYNIISDIFQKIIIKQCNKYYIIVFFFREGNKESNVFFLEGFIQRIKRFCLQLFLGDRGYIDLFFCFKKGWFLRKTNGWFFWLDFLVVRFGRVLGIFLYLVRVRLVFLNCFLK